MIDAITTEIIRHGFLSACEEMARNLCRTSYNTVVYETHDYGVGLHDVNGDIAADAPGIAVFTRGNDYGIKRSIEFLGTDAMKPGDVFINNYPYWSSAHTLDTLVFAPIHVDGRLVGFASCRCHVLDLKQKDPGYVLDSTDMYQEGIVFPVVKLYREGEINEDIFNIVRFNSRLPSHTIGDIQAQVSAVVTGVRRTREIAEKFGVETLTAAMDAINVHGERLALAALRRMPKGTWSAEDYLDNDGVDLDRPIKMAVTITITDDEMIVDWTGSDEGVRGPINLPRGMTEAFNCLIFKGLTTPEWPVTAGNFRPLRVITKEGSVMHAVPPMPTFTLWTGLLGGEVMLKALAQGMPDRVPACSGGDVCSVMALGVDPRTGGPWLEGMNDAVGFGAHAGGDGEDGIMHLSEPGCRNNPVEVLEVKGPVMIDHYGYRPDTGGPRQAPRRGGHQQGLPVSRPQHGHLDRLQDPEPSMGHQRRARSRTQPHRDRPGNRERGAERGQLQLPRSRTGPRQQHRRRRRLGQPVRTRSRTGGERCPQRLRIRRGSRARLRRRSGPRHLQRGHQTNCDPPRMMETRLPATLHLRPD